MQHKKNIYLFLGAFFVIGLCFGVWYSGYIVCIWQGGAGHHAPVMDLRAKLSQTQKKINLYLPSEHEPHRLQSQESSILWFESNLEANVQQLVTQWLVLLYEESFSSAPIVAQFVGYNAESATLYISFSHDILSRSWSLARSMAVIEGLLKTVAQQALDVQQVLFLVNHKPMQHPLLDVRYPWPIFGFSER